MLLRELVEILEERYDPSWAEPWDVVGLVCGDPDAEVASVLFAVDPVQAVVDEAVERGVDALVVHHPLLLTPVSSVAATTPKGRVVHRLVREGIALYTAHTSADVPAHGVNEAIAHTLDLQDLSVLSPTDAGLDKLVVLVPTDAAEAVRTAIATAGAGRIGDYDSCTWSVVGEGRFRPLEGAHPTVGEVGCPEITAEVRVEAVVPRRLRAEVVAAMRAAHPYEEPAYDVHELALAPGQTGPVSVRGHGRVGTLPEPMSLRDFAAYVDQRFPRTAQGVRVAGDPDRLVQRVAVGAGSGESLLEDASRAGVDVFVTSDLKHHRAGEHLEEPGAPALVDVAHWAAEWTWLPVVRAEVDREVAARGYTVDTRVSTIVTDPWTFRV
ncbi:Nif3-like dinuclear metal center hexameric protein [Nocardioides marmoribigeumensis]|uniref:GTP cyclohydrolase 1 type 2 homolog n=1 Tax=Nocardioides marmoribigeumensis TaxID=433649 RepID=A0ABU2BQ40_9ACTN|nr:Nif3-like dinuclear metal center hexameric protein [Nocardioides marmoribigeumensis]MDR7360757.1 dinuclear metal center YbgI/SA1388 family protein [Nocardioides marmoribigeumensis]